MLPGILCDANNYRILIQKDVPRISTMCDGGRAGEPKNDGIKTTVGVGYPFQNKM